MWIAWAGSRGLGDLCGLNQCDMELAEFTLANSSGAMPVAVPICNSRIKAP